MIALPPSSEEVPDMAGWRDPFIFETKGQGDHTRWGILIGSGHKKLGGNVMIYRSEHLRSGGARLPPSAGRHRCTGPGAGAACNSGQAVLQP